MTAEPNEYIVVSKIPEFMEDFFGISSMHFLGRLQNGGERIEVQNTVGDVIDNMVDYDNAATWSTEADG